MDCQALVRAFWADVAAQDAQRLAGYFTPDAVVCWHNTDERFTAAEYVRANCEYPGRWRGSVERIEQAGETAVTVARVWEEEGSSFHAVSFFRFEGGRIARLDEYWGDDGPAPEWRRALHIGRPIRDEMTGA